MYKSKTSNMYNMYKLKTRKKVNDIVHWFYITFYIALSLLKSWGHSLFSDAT